MAAVARLPDEVGEPPVVGEAPSDEVLRIGLAPGGRRVGGRAEHLERPAEVREDHLSGDALDVHLLAANLRIARALEPPVSTIVSIHRWTSSSSMRSRGAGASKFRVPYCSYSTRNASKSSRKRASRYGLRSRIGGLTWESLVMIINGFIPRSVPPPPCADRTNVAADCERDLHARTTGSDDLGVLATSPRRHLLSARPDEKRLARHAGILVRRRVGSPSRVSVTAFTWESDRRRCRGATARRESDMVCSGAGVIVDEPRRA
jgi:hypothetical protein